MFSTPATPLQHSGHVQLTPTPLATNGRESPEPSLPPRAPLSRQDSYGMMGRGGSSTARLQREARQMSESSSLPPSYPSTPLSSHREPALGNDEEERILFRPQPRIRSDMSTGELQEHAKVAISNLGVAKSLLDADDLATPRGHELNSMIGSLVHEAEQLSTSEAGPDSTKRLKKLQQHTSAALQMAEEFNAPPSSATPSQTPPRRFGPRQPNKPSSRPQNGASSTNGSGTPSLPPTGGYLPPSGPPPGHSGSQVPQHQANAQTHQPPVGGSSSGHNGSHPSATSASHTGVHLTPQQQADLHETEKTAAQTRKYADKRAAIQMALQNFMAIIEMMLAANEKIGRYASKL